MPSSRKFIHLLFLLFLENILIDFGRTPYWNCPIPEGETGTPNHDQYTDTTVHSAGANQVTMVTKKYKMYKT